MFGAWMVLLEEIFEHLNPEKISRRQKNHAKLTSMQRVKPYGVITYLKFLVFLFMDSLYQFDKIWLSSILLKQRMNYD